MKLGSITMCQNLNGNFSSGGIVAVLCQIRPTRFLPLEKWKAATTFWYSKEILIDHIPKGQTINETYGQSESFHYQKGTRSAIPS